ncbi:cell adhesion molecule 2-like [Rhodnius prolixus]|uniref:cell adhesion molecule 2-like n=1 Tax=Rhodnius prolixus TaxID=13249 RepID=UPI003D189CFC
MIALGKVTQSGPSRMLRGYWPFRVTMIAVLVMFAPLTGVRGLKSVWLKAPVAVTPGQSATLQCNYDLEGEELYTVKWYKGREEFFRYVPKEHPHTRIFPLPGVNVDLNASGPDRVVLRDVQMNLAGRYSCEVSADAPNFHTTVVSVSMQVVHMLQDDPTIILEKNRYSVGDVLRGNCTTPPSDPAANITWFINGNEIPASYISRRHTKENKFITEAGLEYEVNTFSSGKMEVICRADVFAIYSTQSEVFLDEERPRLASVVGGVCSGRLCGWKLLSMLLLIVYCSR